MESGGEKIEVVKMTTAEEEEATGSGTGPSAPRDSAESAPPRQARALSQPPRQGGDSCEEGRGGDPDQ